MGKAGALISHELRQPEIDIMTDTNTIEVAARGLWRSDPRVNQALWAQGDPQLKSMYLILACVTLNAAERNKKVGEGQAA
jgi:hypothetical protein